MQALFALLLLLFLSLTHAISPVSIPSLLISNEIRLSSDKLTLEGAKSFRSSMRRLLDAIQVPAASFRIWNGAQTTRGRYPYAVSIRDSTGGHLCGGTLISATHVLTAAHCVDQNGLGGSLNGGNPQVYVGYYASTDPSTSYEIMQTVKVTKHPQYDFATANNDVALLELPGASRFPPVALGADPSLLFDGRLLTVFGWGRTEDGSPATALHDVNLLFIPNTTCSTPQMWGQNLKPSMFCAGGGLFDACDGDSGGPILINGGSSGADLQVGIVSWGKAVSCGQPGKPGVYTNLLDPGISQFISGIIAGDQPAATVAPAAAAAPAAQPQASQPAAVAGPDQGNAQAQAPQITSYAQPQPQPQVQPPDASASGASPYGATVSPYSPYQPAPATPSPSGAAPGYGYGGYQAQPGYQPLPSGQAWPQQPQPQQQPAPQGWYAPAASPYAAVPASPWASPQAPQAQPQPQAQYPATQYYNSAGGSAAPSPFSTPAPGSQAPDVPGFAAYRLQDLGNYYDYYCPGTLWDGGCQRDGNSQVLAGYCLQDPQCFGFVALPQGYGDRTTPTGFLKTGPIDIGLLNGNRYTTVYTRAQGPTAEASAATAPGPGPSPYIYAASRAAVQPSKLPGYDVLGSKDLVGVSDYVCPGTLWAKGCQLRGSVKAVSDACSKDKQCSGFVFVPPADGAAPDSDGVGFLKSGSLDLRKATPNSLSALYIKQTPELAPSKPAAGASKPVNVSSASSNLISAVTLQRGGELPAGPAAEPGAAAWMDSFAGGGGKAAAGQPAAGGAASKPSDSASVPPGFQVYDQREISGMDMACAKSDAVGRCVVRGSVADVAKVCTDLGAGCVGFTFYPQAASPLGVLKGTAAAKAADAAGAAPAPSPAPAPDTDKSHPLDVMASLHPNPLATTYVKVIKAVAAVSQ